MRNLNGQQIRQLIDAKQLYETLLAAEAEHAHSFKGSMSWKRVNGADYLYRKRTDKWECLGARSEATEQSYTQFLNGRTAIKTRIDSLKRELERMAPICRAMGLGRMPSIAARILRRLDGQGIIGHGLSVVGTHALFAYESLVSAQYASEHIATADIDLLWDARTSLKMIAPELRETGLLGQLQKVDHSFAATPGSFRAANDKGFLVDLITPQCAAHSAALPRRQIGETVQDQAAAEIEGLEWLQNSPSIREIVIDEKGLPVRMSSPDPRAFAVHKAWLSQRSDREPGKRHRDLAQARAVAKMVGEHLPDWMFDDGTLKAFPKAVRALGLSLIETVGADAQPPNNW